MPEPDPLGLDPRRPDELVSELRVAFPEVHVEGESRERGTRLAVRSRFGSRLDLDVTYPTDIDTAFDAVRQMLRDEALRDRVADLLVAEMGGYADVDLGNAPYILRWLVLAEHVLVTIGDDTAVEPVLKSLSFAVLRSPSRRLKIWRDGAAVLHYDDANEHRGDSTGLDLTRTSLVDFQALWLSPHAPVASIYDPSQPSSSARSPSVAAAIELMVAYAGGAWLRHPRFAAEVLLTSGGVMIDWPAANHLSTIDTEATVQDRAVLAIACHLSGEVEPDVSLADALHFVGDARQLVLESMERVAGAHPDPGGSWPTDCSPSCP